MSVVKVDNAYKLLTSHLKIEFVEMVAHLFKKKHFPFCALSQPIKTQRPNLHNYMCKRTHTSRLQNTLLTEELTALCDTEHKGLKVPKSTLLRFATATGKGSTLSTELLTAPLSQGNSTRVQSLNLTKLKETCTLFTLSNEAHSTPFLFPPTTHPLTHYILVQCQFNRIIAQNFSGLRQELWSLAWLRLQTQTYPTMTKSQKWDGLTS